MPSPAAQLKQLWTYILNGVNPVGAASQNGDIGQMVKWLTANVATSAASPTNGTLWLPGRFTAPADVTIASPTSLTERFNYFRNLTVNDDLTGLAGGTVIIVEQTLTIASGKTITVDALGAKGGQGASGGPSPGYGGYGGGPLGYMTTLPSRSQGRFASNGSISATNPYLPIHNEIWARCANGGYSGGAWPASTSDWLGGALASGSRLSGWALWLAALEFVLLCHYDDATVGGPGGGGGGGGGAGGPGATFGSPSNGILGAPGTRPSGGTDVTGGGGGSGIGGGAAGSTGSTATANGTGGTGGRGGGVLLVFCRTLNSQGTISANGGVGGAATGTGQNGGGGGGGGGLVGVGCETLTALGTLQANGGVGGSGSGGMGGASAGGAGLAFSFKIRSGS